MASKVLNVEVGDRLTKVCMSIPRGKSYQIRNSFMFQNPDNAVSDGQINAPEALAEAIKGQLAVHGINDVKNVVFSLTSGKVASREVMLPPVKDSRLKAVVDGNASDYFPVDLSKYHVTYSLLDRVDKGENAGCRTLVMAAPLSLLEGYFTTAKNAGLMIQAIDFSGNSQYRALCALGEQAVTMYVNVDCTNSYVTFMRGKKLLLQRAFTFGGDELILNYMAAAGKSSDSYVQSLTECSEADPKFLTDGTMTGNDVEDSMNRLVSSLVRTMDYYNSSHWDEQVERVVLMGPCSHLVGLADMVAAATGLETSQLDSLPGVSSLANMAESASCFISCIGASIAPLDFVPQQFKYDRKKARKEKAKSDSIVGGVVILAACVLAAGALSFTAIMNYAEARQLKADLEAEVASLEYTRGIRDAYLQYQSSAEGARAFADSTSTRNEELGAFIGELEEKMPKEILLLSAVCTGEGVSINVTVPGFEEAAVAISQLRSFASIGDIDVSTMTESTDETGGTYVSFSISCRYSAQPLPDGAVQ